MSQQTKQLTKRQLRYQKDKAKKAEEKKMLEQKESQLEKLQDKKNAVIENKNPHQKFVDDMRNEMKNGLPDNVLNDIKKQKEMFDYIKKQKEMFDSLPSEQQEVLIQKSKEMSDLLTSFNGGNMDSLKQKMSENWKQPESVTESPFDLFKPSQEKSPFEALKDFKKSSSSSSSSALDELKNNPFSAIFKRENAGTIADILGSVSSLIKTMVPPSAASNKLTMSGNTKDGSHVSLELNSKFTLDLARRIIGNEEEHHMQKV